LIKFELSFPLILQQRRIAHRSHITLLGVQPQVTWYTKKTAFSFTTYNHGQKQTTVFDC